MYCRRHRNKRAVERVLDVGVEQCAALTEYIAVVLCMTILEPCPLLSCELGELEEELPCRQNQTTIATIQVLEIGIERDN